MDIGLLKNKIGIMIFKLLALLISQNALWIPGGSACSCSGPDIVVTCERPLLEARLSAEQPGESSNNQTVQALRLVQSCRGWYQTRTCVSVAIESCQTHDNITEIQDTVNQALAPYRIYDVYCVQEGGSDLRWEHQCYNNFRTYTTWCLQRTHSELSILQSACRPYDRLLHNLEIVAERIKEDCSESAVISFYKDVIDEPLREIERALPPRCQSAAAPKEGSPDDNQDVPLTTKYSKAGCLLSHVVICLFACVLTLLERLL